MRHLLYSLFLLSILVACKSEPETDEVNVERLVGEFVRVKDNGRVGKAQEDAPVITNITFRSKFCNFTYDGSPMSGKYSVDEGYVYIEAGGELGTLSLEIISANQLEGEGLINGSFMREGFEGEYKYIEDKGNWNGGSASGGSGENASGTGGSYSDGSASEADESGAGSNGAGSINEETLDASKSGTSNSGSTPEAAPKRHVVKHLNTSNMRAGGAGNVGMFLTIDAEGRVVAVKLDRSKTTAKNEVLINSVTAAVKKEVLYNKAPGASYTKVSYVVKL